MKGSSSISVNAMDGGDSLLSSASKVDSGKSHKEAERRRRQRINAHLSTLRSLLPNTIKTDKASLLAEVVQHVRELKRQASDLGRLGWPESDTWQFPGVSDEASLSFYAEGGDGSDNNAALVTVTVCCEDRPGLSRELDRAVRSVRGRAVRAEMATVGGRARHAVVVELAGGAEDLQALKRALKAVVENRPISGSAGPDQMGFSGGNKRARVNGSVDGCECDDLVLR